MPIIMRHWFPREKAVIPEMTYAMQVMSIYRATTRPRTSTGAISLKYTGNTEDDVPIANPITNRPIKRWLISEAPD